MTSSSALPATRRLVLVPAAPSSTARGRPEVAPVRHYRLARLRLEGRDVARSERFSHLKRSYD
jgi:hypothetical protein